MKNAIFTLTVFMTALLTGLPAQAQVSFGNATKFNEDWLFRLTDDSTIVNPAFNDSEWRKLRLPHDWSIEGQLSPSLASCTGYLPGGIGWYRKHFKITDDAPRHYIYFEGVYNRSEVYLNGHLLGKRPNGYISFLYDMTPYLKEGDNVLSVRVDHSRYADSRWYTGSGIYRDVWLIAAPEIHLAQWGTGWHATSLTNRQATIAVDMEVQKHIATNDRLELSATLYDAAGKQVAQRRTRVSDGKEGITKENLTLKITNPHRWNLDDPYLYTLKTELLSNGQRIDGCETKVGLRTLKFDPNKGFALNDNWMKVKGVCLHHDAGVLGAVVPPEVWERRLNNLKEIGVNAIRMSHNPQAPVVYDLCDRLGLLIMDEASDEWEFPKRKWVNFQRHYGAEVKEIKTRNGQRYVDHLEDVVLREGDTLVVMADDTFIPTWGESSVFVLLTNGNDPDTSGKKKRWLALILLVLMIVGATVGELPATKEMFPDIKLDMFFFVCITTIIMAWTNIFPARKYTKYISWDILITIACAFAISKAMVNSGVADCVAGFIIGLSDDYGPHVLLAILFVITNLFTELITNNAAAALAFPLALSISAQLGVSPTPFFVVICMAASASFSTPIGYQTNLIVQGIGNYKFTDFVRIGLPLNIITFLISVILIPLIWNF